MHRRRVSPYLVALGLLWGLPLVLVLVLHVVLPDHNASGQCTGLGFGCTPAPSDAVLFLGYFAALPLLVLGLVACLVIAIVQHRRDRSDPPDQPGRPDQPDQPGRPDDGAPGQPPAEDSESS
ncbi:hypothetical protein GCM10009721_12970 [Terrabacter tumescens]|uniref:Uncharacterized protein n=1 Tax=Terrabacter tumescens TaxID=60443 RepID=A0ABQ2HU90_9MICO|nr:hypothetical protein [Terrabacter tumescens]GGM89189.1 hypothetical protein GCM10009721_12970 [Terrabacter tumescens]